MCVSLWATLVVSERANFVLPVHRSIFGHQKHPKALEPFLPELRAFAEHNHYNVLHPILRYVGCIRLAVNN